MFSALGINGAIMAFNFINGVFQELTPELLHVATLHQHALFPIGF